MSPEPNHASNSGTKFDAFKYQWSRHVARDKLSKDLQRAVDKMSKVNPKDHDTIDSIVTQALKQVKLTQDVGLVPETPGKFKLGIVGAGVAGLFTALAIDWINDTIRKANESGASGELKIEYEILEAADEERFGGRLYTHHFTKETLHDYYDVGAMRFPRNNVMARTFRLFDYLGIKEGKLGDRKQVTDKPVLIPYYLRDDKGVCPSSFNNVRIVGNPWKDNRVDPFDSNEGIEDAKKIPDHLTMANPSDLVYAALRPFVELVDECFREKAECEDDELVWRILRKGDQMSVRQYLLSSDKDPSGRSCCSCKNCRKKWCCHDPFIPGRNYSYNTIQWLETATYGTGWYDQSLTEAALEVLDFEVPAAKAEDTNQYWWCVDGGAQSIAMEMRDKLQNKLAIKYNTQVVGMKANIQLDQKFKVPMKLDTINTAKAQTTDKKVEDPMNLDTNDTEKAQPPDEKAKGPTKPDADGTAEAKRPDEYFVVFNSTTLGAANRMDLSQAGLLWDTKQAIRCLNYGASCKVGIKFQTPWWREAPYNITKGGLARTDLPLQVCVYPSYNIDPEVDPKNQPAVLLVSYTWGQTAQRLATLMASRSHSKASEVLKNQALKNDILQEEAELKQVLLRDLAYLHADWKKGSEDNEKNFRDTLKFISDQYVEHHAYDWYHDPHMAGAFAYFGPCQFSELYPAITKPNALGRLYFVGEAASAHHAWVVGALESVIRALWLMFDNLHQASFDTHGKHHQPYEWAMKLLEKGCFEDKATGKFYPSETPDPSPFFPLPVEMPIRTDKETKNTDLRAGPNKEKLSDRPDITGHLMFGAALLGVALVEYALENWLTKAKEPPVTKQLDETDEKA